ncbi:hypothetical protein F7725_024338 [Dissostichus mawsoni]|uniref:IF rod domain-containing protein n=1 Tax=Dissostichus mawsoni TaxID=36200 RepID=A0A7J5Y143_DISMA|nr:hypothetical protein F7725_024338 [Dissostichus mawsoni]
MFTALLQCFTAVRKMVRSACHLPKLLQSSLSPSVLSLTLSKHEPRRPLHLVLLPEDFRGFPQVPVSSSRMGSASSRSTPGLRSMAGPRNSLPSSMSLYRRVGRSYSPVPADSLDLTQTSVVNNEFKMIRTNEKEQLQGLNDRFAMFIDKVRHLEQQNKVLEMELVTLRQKQDEPSRIALLYQQELRDCAHSRDKNRILIDRNNMEDELQYEEEVTARDEAEQNLRSFRKDVDDATAVRLDLERRLELMMDEINFLRTVHDEEIQELSTMMEKQQVSVELELANPDLTSALKEIRNQYESIASKNLQSAEEWYKSKFASLSEQASRTNEAMRASREEVSEFRRQLQSKTIEIESLRAPTSLWRGRSQRWRWETTLKSQPCRKLCLTLLIIYLLSFMKQDAIGQLDTELRNMKGEMALHLREYQDLLNETAGGEETHFNSGISFGAASYSYQPRAAAGPSRSPREKEGGATKESFKESSEEKDEADINSNN